MSHVLYAELAAEILHHYGRGRHIVAVDGARADVVSAIADVLGRALAAAGASVARRSLAGLDGYTQTVVAAFRAGDGDAILVVDGPILGTAAAESLTWSLWLDTDGPGIGGPGTRTSADAIVDVTDPDHPLRRFSDWCVVPRR